MHGVRILLMLGLVGVLASSANAGTVPVVATPQVSGENTCGIGFDPDFFSWPVVLQATSPCESRLRFAAVPPGRAGDIVSAHATARLFGVNGFEFGVLAADDSVAGSIAVPPGATSVSSNESVVPLQTPDGVVTLVLRSSSGTGEVKVGPIQQRSVTVRVADTTPPTIAGATSAIPANVLLNAPPSVAIRFTDNGPSVGGATATIAWGDGTTSVGTAAAPADPFTIGTQTTEVESHLYATSGIRSISVALQDDAGNVAESSLGTLHVWGVPANVSAPRATGTMRRGSRLSCQPGTWNNTGGPTPLAYRWVRGTAVIDGATARTYILGGADRNKSVGCRVTGANPAGGATVASVRRHFWVAPAALSRPRVTGKARAGSTLTCSTGSWRWSPKSYRYAWARNGSVTSAHGKKLRLKTSNVGEKLACRVTASNPGGQARSTSSTVRIKAQHKPKRPSGSCDPSYPGVCIPPPPPDLDCGQISERNFTVIGSDPHGFDGDNDGIGCES